MIGVENYIQSWKHFHTEYKDVTAFQITTTNVKLLPFLLYLQYEYGYHIFFIRPHRNKSGRASKIEGTIQTQDIIVLSEKNVDADIFYVERSLELEQQSITGIYSLVDASAYDYKCYRAEMDRKEVHSPIYIQSSIRKNPFEVFYRSWTIMHNGMLLWYTDAGEIFAIDAETHSELWRFKHPYNTGIQSIQCIGEILVAFTETGDMYYIDIHTWILQYQYSVADYVSSNHVMHMESQLVCIPFEYASKKHAYGIQFRYFNESDIFDEIYLSSQVSAQFLHQTEGILFVATIEWDIFVFDILQKQQLYHVRLTWYVQGGFIMDAGSCYFATTAWDIYGIDISTWENTFFFHVSDFWLVSTPNIVGNTMYIGSVDSHLYIIDIEKQVLIEKKNVGARIFSSCVFLKEKNWIVFGTNGGRCYIYDIEQKKYTYFQLSERIILDISHCSDYNHFYVQDFMNNLYFLPLGDL